MRSRSRCLMWTLLPAFILPTLWINALNAAEEAENFADRLPRIAPLEPAEAIASFELLPGFRIEQVAAEPLVRDPVALDFDENARLYVVDMCDYSEQEQDNLGAIRLLEDTDGDGTFDVSSTFADGLSWPTAVICYGGGVFVGAAPDLLFMKDTDGDGRADLRKTVFTGFSRSNVQGMLNSFRWGLDCRIHGATGTAGGTITRPDDPGFQAVALNGRDFSFDPRKLDLRPESGGAQHGMCFDDWGRKFVCSNNDHLQMVMFDDKDAARNPLAPLYASRASIATDGPQAEVFRISPIEPWRTVRTSLRVNGDSSRVWEGGGRAAGYFTGASGVTIYRGDAYPEEYRGQAFIGEVAGNLVHRKALDTNGVQFSARRVDEGREFVACTDIWFRPVQFSNSPDGTLYIADMYREVIEHPLHIPPEIKQHLDVTSGRDRGRIYRVAPVGFKQPSLSKLGSASLERLVDSLQHRNGWHRDTATRLLYERQDMAAVPMLESVVEESLLPEGRMHALYAIRSLGALSPRMVLVGLKDEHPRVREHAIRLAQTAIEDSDSSEIERQLYSMANDDDIRVRYQLAFALGDFSDPRRLDALTAIARQDCSDSWVRAAVLSSLAEGAADVLEALTADETLRSTDSGRTMLAQLAEQVGADSRPDELSRFESVLSQLGSADFVVTADLVRGFMSGLRRRGAVNLSEVRPQVAVAINRVVATSQTAANDESLPLVRRQAAVASLSLGTFGEVRETLSKMLESRQPQELQVEAVAALSNFADEAVGEILIQAWPSMSPRVRAIAADAIFSRPYWLEALFAAVEDGAVSGSELDLARLSQLLDHPNDNIREEARQLVAQQKVGTRPEVVTEYRAALSLEGDVERGRSAFGKNCTACHRLENAGHEIGPNLASIKNRGAEAIMLNILDPNREVNPQFVNYLVLTEGGRSLSGMLASETASSITLIRAENVTDHVLRSEIDTIQSVGQSIMPEGLEKQIDLQTMADLLAYLLAVK